MENRPKDINPPHPWNVRIWDVEHDEWLGHSDPDSPCYYGFDIRGGEVTIFNSMDWLYNEIAHGRELIWERSTGLTDITNVEIYEGDVAKDRVGLVYLVGIDPSGVYLKSKLGSYRRYYKDYRWLFSGLEVAGSIHDKKYKYLKEEE